MGPIGPSPHPSRPLPNFTNTTPPPLRTQKPYHRHFPSQLPSPSARIAAAPRRRRVRISGEDRGRLWSRLVVGQPCRSACWTRTPRCSTSRRRCTWTSTPPRASRTCSRPTLAPRAPSRCMAFLLSLSRSLSLSHLVGRSCASWIDLVRCGGRCCIG